MSKSLQEQLKKTIPQFGVYRHDRTLKQGITRAFLRQIHITRSEYQQGFIQLADETRWSLWLEQEVLQALKESASVKCLVSFQVHEESGTRCWAVARLFQEKKPLSVDEALNEQVGS